MNTGGRGTTNYDEQAYNYCRLGATHETLARFLGVSIGVPITKVESKKVTNMVGTFLNEDNNGFEASTTKVKPKKVDATVATFCRGQ